MAQTTAPVAVGLAAVSVAVSLAYGVAALPWQYGKPDLAAALAALGLDPVAVAGGAWHRVFTHWWLHVSVWHLVGTVAVLLGVGTAVERAVGTPRFVCAWVAGGLVAAAGSAWWGLTPTTGGTGGVLALLGVAVCVDGRARVLGPLSGRAAAALSAVGVFGLLGALDWTGSPWQYAAHAVAWPVGAIGAAALPAAAWWRARRWLQRGLRTLAAEPVARERVDALLARIADGGMPALSRAERRFLRRASRFFVAGRAPDAPAPDRRFAPRADARAPRPPAE